MSTTTISTFARTYKDLDLNFNVHPVKKDITKKVDEYAIASSMKNLILTNFYERPFQPILGSDVRRLLFENVDVIVAAQLERAITECITNYEPRARVSVTRAIPDEENNRYNVQVEFFIVNMTAPITITFYLERVR